MLKYSRDEKLETAARVLDWSRHRDYKGHSKHDALNSAPLWFLTSRSRILRLVATQAVMRAPFNIRPLLGVPRLRNPKGIGLFAHAYLDLAEYLQRIPGQEPGISHDACVREAEALLKWLVLNAAPQARPSSRLLQLFEEHGESAEGTDHEREFAGLGWGYHYPWQDVGFFQPAHFPNRVVSSWIGMAFVRAYELTRNTRYLDAAKETVEFLLENPRKLIDNERELCLSYVPIEDMDWAVMDVSSLVSTLCCRVALHSKADAECELMLSSAGRLMRFVVERQTPYGGWFYTWPASDSHIKHDNYHTGIILDCLADYMAFTGDNEWLNRYQLGLRYYEENLFLANVAPRWMNDRTFPHDAHGAAAGILAFTRAARYFALEAARPDTERARHYSDLADRVLCWTIRNLYSSEGYFYYQKGRFRTKRFNLMRWCNAWMSRAAANSLLTESLIESR